MLKFHVNSFKYDINQNNNSNNKYCDHISRAKNSQDSIRLSDGSKQGFMHLEGPTF